MKRLAVMLTLALIAFIGPFGGNMIFPMFGSLRGDLGASTFLLGLTVTAYMIPFGFMQLFSGALSDVVIGRRAAILAGLTVYGIGGLGSALAPDMRVLLGFRAVQGFGNAFTTPIAMAVAGEAFPGEVRGRIMGVLSTASTLGVTLGPVAGGFFSAVSWRLGFASTSVLAVIAAILVAVALPATGQGSASPGRGEAFNVVGQAIKHHGVLAVSLSALLVFAARTGLLTYLSDLLSLPPYGLSEPEIGGLLMLVGLGGIAAGPLWGLLTDKLGRSVSLYLALGMQVPVLVAFVMGSWYRLLPVLLVLYGFAMAASTVSLVTLAVEALPRLRATASSLYGSFRFLGYAIAPPLFYETYIGSSITGVALQALAMVLAAALVYRTLTRRGGRHQGVMIVSRPRSLRVPPGRVAHLLYASLWSPI